MEEIYMAWPFSKLARDLVDIRQGYSAGAENCATS